MHGLVFVTWEKYLAERFGNALLLTYREMIGEDSLSSPLVSKVYNDTQLLAGVGAACQLTGLPSSVILRDYGRYFILNGLTNHLCAYLLSRVQSGKELLLIMREAHAQMRRVPEALTPPLFGYEPTTKPNQFILVYDSPRQLCPLLYGAIEGAAERFRERVTIVESSCMRRGDTTCRFELSFQPAPTASTRETHEQSRRRHEKQILADQVLVVLPEQDGIELGEIQQRVQRLTRHPAQTMPRLSAIQKAITHLQFVGLAASSANQPGENAMHRRYWRAPTNTATTRTEGHQRRDGRSPSTRAK